MKFSNEEKKLADFIFLHRGIKLIKSDSMEADLKPLKDILVDNVKDARINEKMSELLKYLNKLEYIPYLEAWVIPIFPITGEHLEKKNVKKGPLFSKILHSLKETWKNDLNFQTDDKSIETLLTKCDEFI